VVRRDATRSAGEIAWNPATGVINAEAFEGLDAVVHLAGENIAAGRWTEHRKDAIRRSRVESTALLARTLAALKKPPRVWVCASAVGFYGDRGDEWLCEDSAAGCGFLPDVCRDWEAATAPARDLGIRVVNLRIGVVLCAAGGALAAMLPMFRKGLGGVIGGGRQYVSWIAMDDLLDAIRHVLVTNTLEGPANAVAPNPVTNADLTATLARVLERSAVVPLPAFAVKLMFGEMGKALLLEGCRVRPDKLVQTGYGFHHPDLESALRHELGLS
jgi:uncharacterized protein (TIGR01777 family)